MTTRNRVWILALGLTLVVAAGGLSGCKSKKGKQIDTGFDTQTSGAETTSGEGLPGLNIEDMLFSPDRGLKPVYFDYDSFALRPDAIATLRANADMIKQAPNVVIQIAGHCDERGTQEYNFVLGERRAQAVRDFLINLGVSGDRLITISYGEEMPVDPGHNEAAWAKNRRAEFNRAM